MCVSLLCLGVFMFGMIYPNYTDWTVRGGWLMMVYSSQMLIRRLLQVKFDCSRRQ